MELASALIKRIAARNKRKAINPPAKTILNVKIFPNIEKSIVRATSNANRPTANRTKAKEISIILERKV
jgi:hypothetical protein